MSPSSSSSPPSDPLSLLQSIASYYAARPSLSSLSSLSNSWLPSPSAAPASTANTQPHPLGFTVHRRCGLSAARAGTLTLPHGSVPTPVFMPVATAAAVKGLSMQQTAARAASIILSNTYHLGQRPGADAVSALGGLHAMTGWSGCLLTDSGGFQMVSLQQLAAVSEEGVVFSSPVDGSRSLLTPEASTRIQNLLGADVLMQLDDVVSSAQPSAERFAEAARRSVRWLDRCIAAHTRPQHQNLFAIVQGGTSPALRAECLSAMLQRDCWLPGYAIGGLAGGESKAAFWRVIRQCCAALPAGKPRYAMGVGYPLDLLVCVALGVDMFDCVWPCRTARFGSAVTASGIVNLRRAQYAAQHRPLEEGCGCTTCRHYTRAVLAALVPRTALGCHLLSIHNLHFMRQFMAGMRQALLDGRFPAFASACLRRLFPAGDGSVPRWVKDALGDVGLQLETWGVSGPGAEEEERRQATAGGLRQTAADGVEDGEPGEQQLGLEQRGRAEPELLRAPQTRVGLKRASAGRKRRRAEAEGRQQTAEADGSSRVQAAAAAGSAGG